MDVDTHQSCQATAYGRPQGRFNVDTFCKLVWDSIQKRLYLYPLFYGINEEI